MNIFNHKPVFFSTILCLSLSATTQAQVKMNIDATQRSAMISDYQYGLFFEEINHAGDGGLYAELIRNRSFEDNASTPEYWSAIRLSGQTVNLSLNATQQLNSAQQTNLRVSISGASDARKAGISNSGFWGMNFVSDSTYTLTLWVKASTSFNGKLYGQLQKADGSAASEEVKLQGKLETNKWVKLSATIKATADCSDGRFAFLSSNNGTLYLDVVSLMPATWKGRTNGLRPDLAQLLYDTKPSFLRFPGGCYVEGQDSYENAFRWKSTLGPIEERPGHWNNNWHYRSSDGLGYDEYLQLCEDLNAAPMFVVNVGLGHGFTVPFEQVDTLVQNTLDAIEYANGDETTEWGRRRIANGHKEPYGLKFIEVGNENGQPEARFEYSRRYAKFYDAIHAKYPDIVIIGNVEAWGTDNPLWVLDSPVDLVDEHYYRSYQWMRNNYNKYDRYNRSIGVYNGEYAANQGSYGKYGNLNSALGEAIYMLGMEKNSDVCKLASFAPIFTHEQDPLWAYDMIHFNAGKNFCTPSYYVQKLLGNHLGKQNLKWTETGNVTSAADYKVGVGSWATQVDYDDVEVMDGKGNSLLKDDFASSSGSSSSSSSAASAGWNAGEGSWSIGDGMLSQNGSGTNCTNVNAKVISDSHYTYKLRARKTGGGEGFLIIFNYQDADNYCWWNLGGWNNTSHGVEQCVNGSKTTIATASGRIETNRWYDIEIDVDGNQVTCKLDGNTIHQFTLPADQLIYQSAQIDEEQGMLYLKVVNPNAKAATLDLNLKNMKAEQGTVVRLTSENGTDENTMDEPMKVVPTSEQTLSDVNQLEIPAYSLNVFKLKVSDVADEVKDDVLAEDADKYGYLYAHMHASQEITCFALSRYGNSYNDLFNSGEVFDTKKFTQTGGMRDAYVTRTQSGKFMLAGTDMTSRLGWTSNHNMVLMLSNDLVHWDKSISIDLESPENMKALGLTDVKDMTAAWAPQVIYDPQTRKYVVYYSVGFPDRHRIYYSLVNEDLTEVSLPKLYFDPGYDIIDADIVYNKVDGEYVMIYKTESAEHHLKQARAKQLVPGDKTTGTCQWNLVDDFDVYEKGKSIEAPSLFRPIGSRTWKLAYQNYSGGGYRLVDLDEHCMNPQGLTNIKGNVQPQHGSFVKLTQKEYQHLETWEQVVNLLKQARKLQAVQPLQALNEAIEFGDQALATSGSFDEECESMQKAYAALKDALEGYDEYLKQEAAAGRVSDLTFLLQNPDFSEGATGWSGTSFTAASAGVAEHYNKTFDFYQELTGLPNGHYRVEVQSFYRAGGISQAVTSHDNGTEQINAIFYANGEEKPVCSLYDTDAYSVSPYSYPDNVTQANEAFNQNGLYHNVIDCVVTDGVLRLGIRSRQRINADWCCFDNFKLTYLDATTSGIKGVEADAAASASAQKGKQGIYRLDGMKLKSKPAKGFYIQGGKKKMK